MYTRVTRKTFITSYKSARTHMRAILFMTLHVLQGRRANKKLARGEVPPLLLKIDGVVGLETAFAFLKMAPDS